MTKPQPDKSSEKLSRRLDENTVLWGFLSGIVVGVLAWLWRVPRSGATTRAQIHDAGQQLRDKIVPADTIADSLSEGKAIAHRHREQQAQRKS
jgi:gas vesicle protein